MSIWTHVVGCIRIDGIPGLPTKGPNSPEGVERILGPMSLYGSWNDCCLLPIGSEGSLQYRVVVYDKGLPWIAVPIWGDLRDYHDIEASFLLQPPSRSLAIKARLLSS